MNATDSDDDSNDDGRHAALTHSWNVYAYHMVLPNKAREQSSRTDLGEWFDNLICAYAVWHWIKHDNRLVLRYKRVKSEKRPYSAYITLTCRRCQEENVRIYVEEEGITFKISSEPFQHSKLCGHSK